MEVTQALVGRAKAANFEFGADTAFVVVQHMLLQTVDLLRAVADMGQNLENVFALGKVYSNSIPVIRTIREMGVTVTESTMPQPGEFNKCYEHDIKHLWQVAGRGLAQRHIKRIIVLDDGGRCITNAPPDLLRRYIIGGVEQTSLGMFVLEENPPSFGVISWARTAVKLQIGGPIFSHCLIHKVDAEFLNGKPLRGHAIGIIGLGSIGSGMANLTARQGNNVVFYDPDPDLPIPQYLQDKVIRLGFLEELMVRC
jgi:S-adenosylhomocysteine hydrolase